MQTINLLIVEDDEEWLSSRNDFFELKKLEYLEKGIHLENFVCSNYDDAVESIKSNTIDGAIIDLRLSGLHDMTFEGYKIAQRIKDIKTFPIIVYSGNVGSLGIDIDEISSVFLEFFDKDSGPSYGDMIDKFVGIYLTGLTRVFRKDGIIGSLLIEIFWNHLAKSRSYRDHIFSLPISQAEKKISRYITLYLLEYLEDKSVEDEEIEFDHNEFYIYPPVKKLIFSGTLLKDIDGKQYIVLTPPCDCIRTKTHYRIAEIIPFNDKTVQIDGKGIDKYLPTQQKNIPKFERLIRNGVQSDDMIKYHFLPPTNLFDFSGGLLAFDKYQDVPVEELNLGSEHYIFHGVVSRPFMKEILSRYLKYLISLQIDIADISDDIKTFGRQGQPKLSSAPIIKIFQSSGEEKKTD